MLVEPPEQPQKLEQPQSNGLVADGRFTFPPIGKVCDRASVEMTTS
jgi:hypothetical protein